MLGTISEALREAGRPNYKGSIANLIIINLNSYKTCLIVSHSVYLEWLMPSTNVEED